MTEISTAAVLTYFRRKSSFILKAYILEALITSIITRIGELEGFQ